MKNSSLNKFAIIGGGPIGLVTALSLNKNGFKCDLFEKRSWPIDKVCGQGILPKGVEVLENLGIDLSKNDSFELKGIRFISKGSHIDLKFIQQALGVERKVLSNVLYQKSQQADNISLHSQHSIDDPSELSHKFEKIFVCDGLNSNTRKMLDCNITKSKNLRMGARFHLDIKPWIDRVEVHFGKSLEAYVTPVSNNRIEIAFLWFKDLNLPKQDLLNFLINYFPSLKKVINKELISDFKAYGPFASSSSCLSLKNFIFLGDAYKFSDGISGEGLALGFYNAQELVGSLKDPGKSKSVALSLKFRFIKYDLYISMLLLLSRRPVLRQLVFGLHQIFPKPIERLFNWHLL